MKLLLAIEHRFLLTPDGLVYTRGTVDYDFLARYLAVFDEVVVLARIENVIALPEGAKPAHGPGVGFFELPYYLGPLQFLKTYFKLKRRIRTSVDSAEAFILRVPGTIGTMVWRVLCKRRLPYAVEVVADPWDVLAPGAIKVPFRPILRRLLARQLRVQCRMASAAAYVTMRTLQDRYPASCWNTSYSTISLPDDLIVASEYAKQKAGAIIKKIKEGGRLEIVFVGSMAQLYKGQEVLLDAIKLCIEEGLNLHLRMIGGGHYLEYLQSKCEMLGIDSHVSFKGQVAAGGEVFRQLDTSDVFILPSLTEGLPRSVVEAMSRGLYCIGSDVGGIPEQLEKSALFPTGDAIALSELISALFSCPEMIEHGILRNIKKAREYALSRLQERRINFYLSIVSCAQTLEQRRR